MRFYYHWRNFGVSTGCFGFAFMLLVGIIAVLLVLGVMLFAVASCAAIFMPSPPGII